MNILLSFPPFEIIYLSGVGQEIEQNFYLPFMIYSKIGMVVIIAILSFQLQTKHGKKIIKKLTEENTS